MKKTSITLTSLGLIASMGLRAQCTNTAQYPSSTVTISSTAPTTVTSCNYGGEYSVNDFTATGVYTITSTGGSGNYITFTDNSNAPIVWGNSPLTVTITATGLYRIHINTNSTCGTDGTCHNVVVYPPASPPPPPPANDDCSNAIAVTAPGTYTGTTMGATTETVTLPICAITGVSTPGVWYTITTPSAVTLMASLCNTSPSWDSKIFVYQGTCNALTSVGCNDDNGPGCSGTQASIAWCTQPGATYYILVTGYFSAGNFTLDISNPPSPLTVSVNPSNTICSGTTVTLTASGANSYTWNTGATTSTITDTPNSTTTYSVIGTSNAYIGCVFTASTMVVVNSTPTITVNSPTICSGQTATLTASGAMSYTWSTGSMGSTTTVTPSTTTNYTVYGFAGSCTGSATTQVVVATPTITVNSPTICSGQTATLTASGATSYTWNTGTTGATFTDSPTSNTTYTVTGESMGCVSTETAQVIVNPTPSATVSVSDANNIGCNNGSATVSVNGGTPAYTYSWSSPATSTTNVATNLSGTAGSGTTYTVIITDANGCSVSKTFTITCVTSVANISGSNGVKVYPNPNNGMFVIATNSTIQKTIKMMDVTGRVLSITQSSEKEILMNVLELARGTYIIEVTSEKGTDRINIVKE